MCVCVCVCVCDLFLSFLVAMANLQRPIQRAVHQPRHGRGGGGGGGGAHGGGRPYHRGGGDRRPIYMNRGPSAPSSIDSSPFPPTGPR